MKRARTDGSDAFAEATVSVFEIEAAHVSDDVVAENPEKKVKTASPTSSASFGAAQRVTDDNKTPDVRLNHLPSLQSAPCTDRAASSSSPLSTAPPTTRDCACVECERASYVAKCRGALYCVRCRLPLVTYLDVASCIVLAQRRAAATANDAPPNFYDIGVVLGVALSEMPEVVSGMRRGYDVAFTGCTNGRYPITASVDAALATLLPVIAPAHLFRAIADEKRVSAVAGNDAPGVDRTAPESRTSRTLVCTHEQFVQLLLGCQVQLSRVFAKGLPLAFVSTIAHHPGLHVLPMSNSQWFAYAPPLQVHDMTHECAITALSHGTESSVAFAGRRKLRRRDMAQPDAYDARHATPLFREAVDVACRELTQCADILILHLSLPPLARLCAEYLNYQTAPVLTPTVMAHAHSRLANRFGSCASSSSPSEAHIDGVK